VITLKDGALDAIVDEMLSRLSSKASFFVGGRVALRVRDRPLSVEQLQVIGGALQEHGVTLWAVEGTHPQTYASARELGLETRLRASSAPRRTPSAEREQLAGIVVRGTLRSGGTFQNPGHVTLIGDVNPGAKLVAGGDIVVWGKLRGTVHAGAADDDQAVICALLFAPSQIRIGSHIARAPERDSLPTVPEIARVEGGHIVVEPWDAAHMNGSPIGSRGLGTWNKKLKSLLGQRQP
jgi:septum site-determining protein MinC